MKWRSVLTAAAALVLLAVPVSAQTVEDGLKVVPKDAVAVVVVNNLSDANSKVVELAELVGQPLPFASPLAALKKHLGIHKGIKDDGAALLVVFNPPHDEGEPPHLAYVPVSDYETLLKELKAKGSGGDISEFQHDGKNHVLARKGSFAVVTEARYKKFLEKALQPGSPAAGLSSLQLWLSKNQISGVLTTHGLKLIGKKAREGLKKAKDKLAENPQPGTEFMGPYLDGMADFLETAGKDVKAAGIGLRVGKSANVRLMARAVFVKGSSFSKFASELEVPEGGPLAGLPARQFALAVGGALPEKAMERLMEGMSGMMKSALQNLPDEQKKELAKAYADSGKGLRGMAIMVAVPKEGESLFGNIIALVRADSAKRYLKNGEKMMKVLDDLLKGANLPVQIPIATKQTKVKGRPAMVTTIDLSGVPNIAAGGAILEALFGSADKITMTAVAIDDHTVLSSYSTPAELGKILAASKTKGGVQSMSSVSKVNAMLPKGAQWVGFVDPHGGMELVRKVIGVLPLPAAPQLPEMPKMPPAGFALKLSSGGMDGELIVPAETVRGVARFAREVRKQNEGQ